METQLHKPAAALALLLALASRTPDALGHHNSGAQFDLDRETTIEGTVSRYEWVNPHVYLFLDVTDELGRSVEWQIEAGPVALMKRMGWSRETLALGDRLVVVGNPGRSRDRSELLLVRASKPAGPLPRTRGREAFEALQGAEFSFQAEAGLAGTWVTLPDPNSNWIDEPDSLPLTEQGQRALAAFAEREMLPGIRCIPYPPPMMMLVPDTKSIEIGDGVIWIRGEFDGTERRVRMADSPADPAGRGESGAVLGHSVGRWKDGVLIVETSGFAGHRSGNGYGLPSGTAKRLTERFELDPDRTSLTYRFEVTDPDFLEDAVKGQVTWQFRPDLTFQLLACDPENARRFVDE